MRRSSLPNAIRGTLNSLAFDVKQKTIPKIASKKFTVRRANFFKANSRVKMAKGFNMDQMEAIVGFKSLGRNNPAVDNLEFQERGGTIKDREFIPVDKGARISGSSNRIVSKRNQLRNLPKLVHVNKMNGINAQQKFMLAVMKAKEKGLIVSHNRVMRVERLNTRIRPSVVSLKTLYSYEKNRDVKVEKTNFMKTASNWSASKSKDFYKKQFERELNKIM